MLLEFCSENFTKVPKAIQKGVKRIELCDNLAQGGTTPSYAIIEQTINYAHKNEVTVATMVRPRGGDFVYTATEFEMMKKDLEMIKKLGSDGIVFGCLTKEGRINRKQTKQLIDQSEKMETVFHMAFDQIPKEHQKEDMKWLIDQKVTRILTHGGIGGSVNDHINWLKTLIEYADSKIEILIGGGVTHSNYQKFAKIFLTNQFHGTQIVEFDE